jgi:CelD/BcsL family acetyltransferase involved in cellulose biosynthesis
VLCTLEQIEQTAQAWSELETACGDPLSYFQSYDWCRNWVARFCKDGGRTPYVVTVWQGEALVALWPRMIVENLGLKRLETLGVPHTQYCGLLIRPAMRNDPEVAQCLNAAMRSSGCDVLLSRAILSGSALDLVVGEGQEQAANVASMLDLSRFSSVQDYTDQLGKRQKRNRNRRRNHLARLGELHFEVLWPADEQFAPLVEQCVAMKRRWLKETGKFSTGFSMGGVEAFLQSLDGDASKPDGACLSVLRVGGRVLAMELGFIQRGHYYAYLGGFDWNLRDLSPGKVQMEYTVAWLIEHHIQRYDLLINPAEYKASWTNTEIPIAQHVEALSWRGRFYATVWLRNFRPMLKRVHARLPATFERIRAWLQPAACLLLYV